MVIIKKYLKWKREKRQEFNDWIFAIIWYILKDEEFIKLKKHRHHLFFNRYEHLINTSRLAYKLSKMFSANVETCTLAWILHDFHNTKIKWYKHWVISAENAKRFNVSEEVLQIIRCHMYPFWRTKVERFKGKDFRIVKTSDFISMFYEISYSILFLSFRWKNKIKLKKNSILLEKITQ